MNAAPTGPQAGFFTQFARLSGGFWTTDKKVRAWVLTSLVIALTVAQVATPVLINIWTQNLFNALEQRSMERFLIQVGVLGGILVVAMAVTSAHLWVKRRLQIEWRKWLTARVMDRWARDGRHYQVTFMPGEHDNPDGRIAEDIRNTCESAIDLAHSLLYCLLLLISFTQILWGLSGILNITLFETEWAIPGHMVFASILYATFGTTIAILLGRPLVRAVNLRQSVEANFRFGLVRVRENSEAIALLNGEPDERRRLGGLLLKVREGFNHQTNALTKVFLFSSGYGVLATGFPFLIAAPRYIAGAISLGELMQIAQAFQQMTAALSWPVDNLSKFAEWRASVERVLSLTHAVDELVKTTEQAKKESSIVIAEGQNPNLTFHDLTIARPDGRPLIAGFSEEIQPGERVLITGDPGAALKLFKVVAGLWPWGRGQITMPMDRQIFFMPQRPYLPIARLRSVLSYPAGPEHFEEQTLIEILEQVKLANLAHRLDESANWANILTLGEQQRLGFARLLLHRPNWIFIQEATDALHAEGEQEMMQLLTSEFPKATVLTVGYHALLESYHHRKLELEMNRLGEVEVHATPLQGRDRRRRMRPLDIRSWLRHPLRRQPQLHDKD